MLKRAHEKPHTQQSRSVRQRKESHSAEVKAASTAPSAVLVDWSLSVRLPEYSSSALPCLIGTILIHDLVLVVMDYCIDSWCIATILRLAYAGDTAHLQLLLRHPSFPGFSYLRRNMDLDETCRRQVNATAFIDFVHDNGIVSQLNRQRALQHMLVYCEDQRLVRYMFDSIEAEFIRHGGQYRMQIECPFAIERAYERGFIEELLRFADPIPEALHHQKEPLLLHLLTRKGMNGLTRPLGDKLSEPKLGVFLIVVACRHNHENLIRELQKPEYNVFVGEALAPCYHSFFKSPPEAILNIFQVRWQILTLTELALVIEKVSLIMTFDQLTQALKRRPKGPSKDVQEAKQVTYNSYAFQSIANFVCVRRIDCAKLIKSHFGIPGNFDWWRYTDQRLRLGCVTSLYRVLAAPVDVAAQFFDLFPEVDEDSMLMVLEQCDWQKRVYEGRIQVSAEMVAYLRNRFGIRTAVGVPQKVQYITLNSI